MSNSELAQSLEQRLAQLRQNLPDSVRLIAVTKQVPIETMRIAYALGLRDFAESRIQEAAAKQAELSDWTDVNWHLIGHLQTNKAAKALELFQWIHSLDSRKLAERLDQLAANLPQKPNLCLQVKILPDPNKYGWSISELLNDLPHLDQYSHLNIVGLMAIPPYGLDPDQTLSVFTQTQQLAEKIRQQSWQRIQMQELSIGMSGDYPLAIEAGATMVRLGRILFGERA
ncbi:MAG: YggS family pyridoxal phosphate-dependent enzyme [Leptolyngbyaceae cyanobacterium RM2_2_4]|nr:YggS family pyridoxal phosphate-dependent enzyme [Leptolyngbyaceae cyanobacterium RM2_2_4]